MALPVRVINRNFYFQQVKNKKEKILPAGGKSAGNYNSIFGQE